MKVDTRTRVLIGLLVVVILVVGVRMLTGTAVSGGLAELGGAFRGQDTSDLAGVEVLSLRDDLPRDQADFRPGRDPWRFASVKATPTQQTPSVVTPPPPQPKPTPAQPPPSATPSKPKPPPVDVEYLGSFGPSQRKIAVFTDSETIYNAALGDVLKGKFKVHDIGYESVDLQFVGFPDEPPKRLAQGGGR